MMNAEFDSLKNKISDRLIAQLDAFIPVGQAAALFEAALRDNVVDLPEAEMTRLRAAVLEDVEGIAPLEALLSEPGVTEIMVNGHESVYVERRGKLEPVQPSPFRSSEHLMRTILNIATVLGREVNESNPILDLRLQDGSRVHVVVPPIALNGPTIVIRKLMVHRMTLDMLYEYGALSPQMGEFIRACVLGRLNIVISGGTGSGKTTVQNVIAEFIPDDERIIILQHDSELMLRQPHVVKLETRPPNLEGRGEITLRQLVESALKMRPDRIVVSESQGGEVWTLLQALNNGYDGSMLNLHASSVRDALTRLEVMSTEANPAAPLLAIRHLLASGVHLVMNQQRLHDGTRRLVSIAEVTGLKGDVVTTQDIFQFVETGVVDGRIQGYFTATGYVPGFMQRITSAGIQLAEDLFAPRA